jgi:hypothetical protein
MSQPQEIWTTSITRYQKAQNLLSEAHFLTFWQVPQCLLLGECSVMDVIASSWNSRNYPQLSAGLAYQSFFSSVQSDEPLIRHKARWNAEIAVIYQNQTSFSSVPVVGGGRSVPLAYMCHKQCLFCEPFKVLQETRRHALWRLALSTASERSSPQTFLNDNSIFSRYKMNASFSWV